MLVVTASDLDHCVYQALKAGVSGFLPKDEPPETLAAAVRTVAAGDALLAPDGCGHHGPFGKRLNQYRTGRSVTVRTRAVTARPDRLARCR